ncbi:MAG: choice-of-anchor B family protein [Armatimonadetes bacterium]|nr:choice-of-anchor B family protein [Armatimonadota bacterium]
MKNSLASITGLSLAVVLAFLPTSSNSKVAVPSSPPENNLNVDLLGHIGLATFGYGAGNDCWGYVSPSGREYAIMGFQRGLAVIEVSDPDRPIIIGRIPHAGSTWCDIKVYGEYAYAATEVHRSGLQVIDLTQVDSGIVRLARTVMTMGDAHNLAIDTDSGYLYACAVNTGTGTTMCLDLSDPANPTPVGRGSMTTSGQHDMQVVTYHDGPYAGRQIMFGSSGGRGLQIIDVTDKNNPFYISGLRYPGLEYNHQGWLSEDKRYWYMDDELDEYRGRTPTTRTLVADVSNLSAPFLASTFTTGLPAIDHNLYVKCGFVFESNYSSGLHIFDATDDRLSPTETGFYDTYPANDNPTFNGTWSNFPFFPSGTVILSDRQSGLFVFDVSAATVRPITADSHRMNSGAQISGNTASLATADGDYLVLGPGITPFRDAPDGSVSVFGAASCEHASNLTLRVAANTGSPGLRGTRIRQEIDVYDWRTLEWVTVSITILNSAQFTATIELDEPTRFIQAETNFVSARARYYLPAIRPHSIWSVRIDELSWTVNP